MSKPRLRRCDAVQALAVLTLQSVSRGSFDVRLREISAIEFLMDICFVPGNLSWWKRLENDNLMIIIAVVVSTIIMVLIICIIIILVCRRKRAADKCKYPSHSLANIYIIMGLVSHP